MQSERRHQLFFLTPDTSIDSASAVDMLEQTRLALDDGCRDLVIDLHSVPYIAGAGLEAILQIAALLEKAGGCLALAGLRGQTQSILQVSGLGHMLLHFDTAADAERHLQHMRTLGPAPAAIGDGADSDEDFNEDDDEDEEEEDDRLFNDE